MSALCYKNMMVGISLLTVLALLLIPADKTPESQHPANRTLEPQRQRTEPVGSAATIKERALSVEECIKLSNAKQREECLSKQGVPAYPECDGLDSGTGRLLCYDRRIQFN